MLKKIAVPYKIFIFGAIWNIRTSVYLAHPEEKTYLKKSEVKVIGRGQGLFENRRTV